MVREACDEVELMAEAIGAMAAFKAVTSVAARYLRQQDNIGSIAPYKSPTSVDPTTCRSKATAKLLA